MERKNHFIIMLLVMLIPVQVLADRKTEIYKAYIGNNMPGWKNIIDKMEPEKNKTNDFILELVNYQYGYIGWCIGNNKEKEAEKYLKLAEKNLEILEENGFKPSEISAYKSAFYGFKIGLSPIKAPFFGPKSVNFAELAMKQDPANPMGYIQYGNGQFHMPPVFGGSKKVAVEHFLKAEKLMENNREKISNDWNYISLLALIGQSYDEMEDYKNARFYYEKALNIEPGFLWVKKELLPELLKKQQNQGK